MNKDIERRVWTGELRAIPTPGAGMPTLTGYAAVFNKPSQDLGGFTEFIRPGAFADALTQDVRALVDHNPSMMIGRLKAGTLRMTEDEVGLKVEIDLPDTSVGRDLAENVRLGNIDGMSFGMMVKSDDWRSTPEGTVRELISVDLLDVSPVTFPAYLDSSISLRALDKAKEMKSRRLLDEASRRLRFAILDS